MTWTTFAVNTEFDTSLPQMPTTTRRTADATVCSAPMEFSRSMHVLSKSPQPPPLVPLLMPLLVPLLVKINKTIHEFDLFWGKT